MTTTAATMAEAKQTHSSVASVMQHLHSPLDMAGLKVINA
jgi:hypothetical protein